MQFNKLISELKRRNVFRVATAYAIVGWLIIQVVVAVNEPLSLPGWFDTAVILFVIAGFPIAVIVAWAFELTPDGIKKTDEVVQEKSISQKTGQKLNRLIITAMAILIVFLLVERIFFAGEYSAAGTEVMEAGTVSEISEDRSVAVLPFADFSPDNDQEWFADGLTEEILNSLVRTPDLKVAARTSSFKYKGSSEEIPVIAAALGVDHVLEGSVRRTKDRLRVTAQLIRAKDGFHIWSETFDQTPDDAIKIQEEVALSIARALNTAMDSAALSDMIRVGTSSIPAYNAYLEGLVDLGRYVKDDSKVIGALNKARELDPDFAEAHYNAARYWSSQLSITQIGVTPYRKDFDVVLQNFRECIRDAISVTNNELDKLKYRLTEAEVNLRWREAEELYDLYFAERPNDFSMMESYIRMLIKMQELEKANLFMQKLEKDQGGNDDTMLFLINYYIKVLNGEASSRLALQALGTRATDPNVMYQVQRALLWDGNVEKASEAAANYLNFVDADDPVNTSLIQILKMRQLCAEGKRDEAEELLKNIEAMEFEDASIWHVYMAMGKQDKAQEITARFDTPEMVRQLSSYLTYLQFDPRPFSELMKIIEREGVVLHDPVRMPFALN